MAQSSVEGRREARGEKGVKEVTGKKRRSNGEDRGGVDGPSAIIAV